MIIALCLLGSLVVFLLVALLALYTQVIRPMKEQLVRQDDTIARNAGAAVGLYFAQCREINQLANKVELVEAYVVPVVPVEEAPITVRSERMQVVQ